MSIWPTLLSINKLKHQYLSYNHAASELMSYGRLALDANCLQTVTRNLTKLGANNSTQLQGSQDSIWCVSDRTHLTHPFTIMTHGAAYSFIFTLIVSQPHLMHPILNLLSFAFIEFLFHFNLKSSDVLHFAFVFFLLCIPIIQYPTLNYLSVLFQLVPLSVVFVVPLPLMER